MRPQKIGRLILTMMILAIPLGAEEVKVEVRLQSDEIYLGNSMILEIRASGTLKAPEVTLPEIDGVSAQFVGGKPHNNSYSIRTSINGQVKTIQQEDKSYVLHYNLIPRVKGIIWIPSIKIRVEGRDYFTDPVSFTVKTAEESDLCRLKIETTTETPYIGQPVEFFISLYYPDSITNPQITIPFLQMEGFDLIQDTFREKSGSRYFQIPVNGENAIFENSGETERIEGKVYHIIRLEKMVVFHTPGVYSVRQSSANYSVTTGYRIQRDSFGFSERVPVQEQLMARGNEFSFRVKSLPEEGRPANFSGLIGDYKMEVTANPLEVKVGDPITLKIILSGPSWLKDVDIPDLSTLEELAVNFKIPAESAPGIVENGRKEFTRTIRANHQGVQEIPGLKIPYFNTETGHYSFLESSPLKLEVTGGENKTFSDLEGGEEDLSSELEGMNKGIAHNYEGVDLLKTREVKPLFRDPFFLAVMIIPILVYLVLLFLTRFSHLFRVSEEELRARKAFSFFKSRTAAREVKDFSFLLDELNLYLTSRLKLPVKGALGFRDVEPVLRKRGLREELLGDLMKIYETCEAGAFAGASRESAEALLAEMTGVLSQVERSMK